MPAFPKQIIVNDSVGNIVYLSLQGDENIKYAIEEQTGFTAVMDSTDCWRYLVLDDMGTPTLSNFKVSNTKIEDLPKLLINTPKALLPLCSPLRKSCIVNHLNDTDGTNNKVVGERKALIILAEFPDKKFKHRPQDFELLFNEKDYSLNDATGSVADYFNEISEGQLNLSSTIIGPFTSQRNMSYYGRNDNAGGSDSHPFTLFQEALDYAKSSINLKEYDCNGDGLIDNIHIIYAGYGEEAGVSSNSIWAHECTFEPINISTDLKIDRYSCSPELRDCKGNTITTIGPPCHEICHALGAMDYYDTDYFQGGEYQGTSVWDIMASGSWNNGGATPAWPNPYVRAYDFGWSEPEVLNSNGSYDFKEISKRKIYRVDSTENNDYFLIEYRDGKYFSASEPGSGMLIFHIGPDISKYAKINKINASFPQQCYPVCASSAYAMPNSNPESYGNIPSASCAFSDLNGHNAFNKATVPGALSFSGKESNFSIYDIHEEQDNIFFSFSVSSEDINNNRVLWQESFKKTDTLNNWEQKDITGHAIWSRYSNLNESATKYYLSLRPVDGKFNPREIKTQLCSPDIIMSNAFLTNTDLYSQTTDLEFSADIRNITKTTASWEFIFMDNNNIVANFNIELDPDKEWFHLIKKMSIDFEETSSLKLIINTKMELGTDCKLELSNLNLILNESTAEAINTSKDCQIGSVFNIFDISGHIINKPNTHNLSNGIYIIHTPTGIKKVLIKNNSN